MAYHLCDQYKITCNIKRNNFYIIWFPFHQNKFEAVKAIKWIYFEILNRNSFKFIIFKNNETSRIYNILHFGITFVDKKTRDNKISFDNNENGNSVYKIVPYIRFYISDHLFSYNTTQKKV